MCGLMVFLFVKTKNNCPKTRSDYRSVFLISQLYKFVWLQTTRFWRPCVHMFMTYRFPVIIISNIFVETLRRGLLHYLMFHLQEHVLIAMLLFSKEYIRHLLTIHYIVDFEGTGALENRLLNLLQHQFL